MGPSGVRTSVVCAGGGAVSGGIVVAVFAEDLLNLLLDLLHVC